MDNELIKEKYRQLLNKLYRIRNKYQELDRAFDDLNSSIKENLIVDGEIIVVDSFNNIKSTVNSLENELANNIIPNVSNRI